MTAPSRKRGRPVRADSAATRARLIDAAREAFAVKGFDGTSIGAVAGDAGMVASGVYHYFPDKETLYEAVFAATASHLWSFLDERVSRCRTARDGIAELVRAADEAAEQLPFFGPFLAAVPVEAGRCPRFTALLEDRNALQRPTFERIAELGVATGELQPAPAGGDLPEDLRVLVVGWLAERGRKAAGSRDAVTGLLSLLCLPPHA